LDPSEKGLQNEISCYYIFHMMEFFKKEKGTSASPYDLWNIGDYYTLFDVGSALLVRLNGIREDKKWGVYLNVTSIMKMFKISDYSIEQETFEVSYAYGQYGTSYMWRMDKITERELENFPYIKEEIQKFEANLKNQS